MAQIMLHPSQLSPGSNSSLLKEINLISNFGVRDPGGSAASVSGYAMSIL